MTGGVPTGSFCDYPVSTLLTRGDKGDLQLHCTTSTVLNLAPFCQPVSHQRRYRITSNKLGYQLLKSLCHSTMSFAAPRCALCRALRSDCGAKLVIIVVATSARYLIPSHQTPIYLRRRAHLRPDTGRVWPVKTADSAGPRGSSVTGAAMTKTGVIWDYPVSTDA